VSNKKKKKQQEAVQRAQKFVSGDKLQKSEVKKLESKGFSSKQIQAVASSMGSVGSNAQQRIDNKHSSNSGSNSGSSNSSGPSRVQTVGGTHRIRVDGQGRVNASTGFNYSSSGIFLTKDAAKKINTKVEKAGGSLVGGKGMSVSRYVTIRDPGRPNFLMNKSGGPSRIGGGKHQFAIYAPVAQAEKRVKPADNKKPDPVRDSGKSGNNRQDRAQANAYQRAQDHISGRTAKGKPPELFPDGVTPGRAVEGVADYANRLGTFNANYSGWMQGRAESDRYQSGRLLQAFAQGLPKAPDVLNARDMIDMANRMNNKIKIS